MRREKATKTNIIRFGVIAFVVLLGCAVWYTAARIGRLESELGSAYRTNENLTRELSVRTEQMQAVTQEAKRAREAAEQAAAAAANQATARADAELSREEAEQAKAEAEKLAAQAEKLAADARARESVSRQELAELNQRRKQELDRMQEALNRIAPTRRTASGMVVELANDSFLFDFNQAKLRPENREILSRIAGVLLASQGYRLVVYGHTDDTGSAEYNQQLSERRAKAVADYLVQAGVPNDILAVQGLGKTSPREDNRTPQGREKNRRVEIGIVDSIIDYKGVADVPAV